MTKSKTGVFICSVLLILILGVGCASRTGAETKDFLPPGATAGQSQPDVGSAETNARKETLSEKDKVHLIQEAGSAARWGLKGADRDAVIQWLWKVAETDTLPFIRQECL